MVIRTLTWLECGRWRDTLAADQTDEHFDQHAYEGDVYEGEVDDGDVYEGDVYDDHNGVDDAFDNDNVNADDTIAIARQDTLIGVRRVF